MVTICQQCGDVGYANAFVYCVKCLDSALHRYCLDEIPATRDEFVYWLCEDCEPEVTKRFPIENPSSCPSKKRDHASSRGDQATTSKRKLKKNEVPCLVKEQRCQSSPSQQPDEAHEKLDFESAHLADDCPLLKTKVKKKSDSTCPVAATKFQSNQSRQTKQCLESRTKPDMIQYSELESDCQLKIKSNMKNEKGFASSVDRTEEQRHQHSSSQKSFGVHRKLELSKRARFSRICSSREKRAKKKKDITLSVTEAREQHRGSSSVDRTEEQRHQRSSSQISFGVHRKRELSKRARFSRICSSREKRTKKKKDITLSVAEAGEQHRGSNSSLKPREAYTKLEFTECAKLAGDFSLPQIKTKREKENLTPSVAETEVQKPQSSQPQHSYRVHRELEEWSRLDEEVGCVRADASQTALGDVSNTLELGYHLHAQPIIDPIWRGSFDICKRMYRLFDGVVAHLSSKACPKVYEEASFLPATLSAEMLPKLDVWPKSFERSRPRDDNIALYFFPQNKTYENVFDSMVGDMITGEFSMRVMLKNAELLVFTSDMLPLKYWKFQGKYYLWGVFKGKKTSSTHQVNYDLMAQNSNNKCDVKSNSPKALGTTQREPVNTKTWDARSPLSPLSKSDGEHEQDMELGYEDFNRQSTCS